MLLGRFIEAAAYSQCREQKKRSILPRYVNNETSIYEGCGRLSNGQHVTPSWSE